MVRCVLMSATVNEVIAHCGAVLTSSSFKQDVIVIAVTAASSIVQRKCLICNFAVDNFFVLTVQDSGHTSTITEYSAKLRTFFALCYLNCHF